MDSNFDKAFDKLIAHEGGYVNDPRDRGGETYMGIARKFWPKWEGWKIVDAYRKQEALTDLTAKLKTNAGLTEMVKDFYRFRFWNPLKCYELPYEIAFELFDTGVNQGTGSAAKHFQKALNKLNRNARDYADIKPDGDVGLNTLKAFDAYMATQRFSSRNEQKLVKWLLKWMNYYQLQRYDNITERDKQQECFIPGWTERT